MRYYLERRDEAFEAKMAEVLCVYREVAIMKRSEKATTLVRPFVCMRREAWYPSYRKRGAGPAATAW